MARSTPDRLSFQSAWNEEHQQGVGPKTFGMLPMSRTTFAILAAGLAVAACNHASEQRTDEADALSQEQEIAGRRVEKVADKLFAALTPLPDKAFGN